MNKNFNKKIILITAVVLIILITLIFIIIKSTPSQEKAQLNLTQRDTLTEYQEENTYILTAQKDIQTTINGDLFLITTDSNIQGTINEDLNAIALKTKIQGIIGDDLRLISTDANLNVYVFNEMMIISDILHIANTTVVNGKTNIQTTSAKIHGTYNDDVKITANRMELNAIINGDAQILAEKIIIHPQTRIQGNLEVREGTNIPENTVTGNITYTKKERISTTNLLLEKITLFLIIIILAGLIHIIAQKQTDVAIETLIMNPIKSSIIGIIALILLPIISIILLVSIITAPIGIILMMALITLLILTPALAAILIGKQIMELIRTRREIRLEILIGTLVLVMLSFIPGFIILATILFYALFIGAIILLLLPRRKIKTNGKKKTVKKKKRKK